MNQNIEINDLLIIKSYLWFLFYYFLDSLKLFIPYPFDDFFEKESNNDYQDECIKDIEEMKNLKNPIQETTIDETKAKDQTKDQTNIDTFQVSKVNVTIKRNNK